jgi:Holliday junction resolvasome RuvABC endonuclease subunit
MGKLRSKIVPRWPNKVLTVDPGFGGTGWAYWVGNEYPIFGVIKERARIKLFSDEVRLTLLFQEFRILLGQYKPTAVILESMQLWTSLTSQTSASRGDLFLLQTLVGGYCAVSTEFSTPFQMLTPMRWKGQLSKEALRSRILLITNVRYPDHAEDAVGIGFHLAGVL